MSKRINTALGERSMASLEHALRDIGIDLYNPSVEDGIANANNWGAAAFSGYGEFTPITVRADTKLSDADLERNQFRDRPA
jgi:hypothetical protein